MLAQRKLRPSGTLGLTVMRGFGGNPFGDRSPIHVLNLLKHALPRPGLSREVNTWRLQNLPYIAAALGRLWLARWARVNTAYGALFLRVNHGGIWTELGLGSLRVITNAGVNQLATYFAGTSSANVGTWKFAGFGSGTAAESTGDTALGTEFTTQYAVSSTRPTGTQSSSTNTYTMVATLTPSANVGVTEHGVFDQAATGGGHLWDRSVFSVINLVAANPDSLQATYVLTLVSGG